MAIPFWPFHKPKSKLEILQESVQNIVSGAASGVHDKIEHLPLERVSVPLSVAKEGATDTLGHASSAVASALSSTAMRAAEAGHVLADAKQTLVEKAGAGLHGAAETASHVAHGAKETASGVAHGVVQTAGNVSGSAADSIQTKVKNMHQTTQEHAAHLAEQAREAAEAARKATRQSAKTASQVAASGGEATLENAQAAREQAAKRIAAAVAALSETTAQASQKARQRAEEARRAAEEAAAAAAKTARLEAQAASRAEAEAATNEANADAEAKASQTRSRFPARLLRRREEQLDVQLEDTQRAEALREEALREEAEREEKLREEAQAAAIAAEKTAKETNKKLKKEKRRAEKKHRDVVVERDVVRGAPEAVRYAPQVQVEDSSSKWLWVALGALAGASLMVFFAPSNGRRSRALVKDKLKSAGSNAAKLKGEAARRAADLRNRAEGKLHEVQSGSEEDFADDNTVADRVRTALGENDLTRNLERLNIDCVDGVVTLRGPMVDEELRAQIETLVGAVKGVREVRSHLLLSDAPEDTQTFVG